VRKWIKEHDDFSKSIARAGDDQADYYRWRISKLNDSMTAANWQFVNAQIHNIQWLMAKLKAKYGDKTAITGADGGAIQIVSTIPRPPVV
jgi:long-subunit acyl-CoA synthetase (AMP-forming)